jgi:hypothetical protein
MAKRVDVVEEEKEPTADEVTIDSRCPLTPSLDNDLRIIVKNNGLTKCEQVEKVLGEWTEYKKLESECIAQANAGVAQDDRCKGIKSSK